ncbi:MAG: ATP-binding protein [Planctomycetota bacterium]
MSSTSATDRSWSLTRRMTVLFTVTTLCIVALYGLWATYLVFHHVRQETRDFLEHELEELKLNISHADLTKTSIRQCVQNVIEVSGDKPIAFRVRSTSGNLLVEQGNAKLRSKAPGPLARQQSSSWSLLTERFAAASHEFAELDMTLEVIVDTSEETSAIYRYLRAVFFTFLVAAALSGVAGWFTAHRGLRGLRQVVTQAQGIESSTRPATIELSGAPDEIREVATALNSMLERIHAAMDGMRTFTAGLAHELRSPLQNLLGETEVALLTPRSPEEYQELLASNLEDLSDLSDAVDNLIAFCRVSDPDRRELRTEYFDLASEARLRVEGQRREATRKKVAIEIQSLGNTGLFADREGCLRVVRNLVGNAVEWAPPDSTVEVRIQGNHEGVRLFVMDRGPGVQEQLRDRIFEPFVSGRCRAQKRAGYGLGLAICHSVLQEHGGEISFEPRESGGSTFVARFPRGSVGPG